MARSGHCFGNRCEGWGTITAMLDDVFPPPFRIVVAGRCSERTERVRRRLVDNRATTITTTTITIIATTTTITIIATTTTTTTIITTTTITITTTTTERQGIVASCTGKGVREWQVDGANFDASLVRPCDALPLGAERCKRCKDRPRRFSNDVAQQRNRWNEFAMADPRQRRLDIGRSLDEDDRRLNLSERGQHRPSRPRPMVADAQQVNGRQVNGRRTAVRRSGFVHLPTGHESSARHAS